MPFPVSPNPGDSYTDAYGTVWIYAGSVNGWYRQQVSTPNDTSYTSAISGPAGSNTQVQFNDNGFLAGDSGLTFNKTTNALSGGAFIPTGSTVPTNGVYLPASNSLALATNSLGRLFVDASGRVGVGVSPVRDFHMHQPDVGSDLILKLSNAFTGSTTSDGFEIQSFVSDGSILFNNRENADLQFRTNNTERLCITSAGLVGIGTSSPGAKLTVAQAATNADTDGIRIVDSGGSPRANLYYRGSQVFEINSSSAPGGGDVETLRLSTAGNARLSITRDGKVGIGTTNPAQLLHVAGSGAGGFTLERTGSIANASIEYKTTSGSVFAGQGSGNVFTVGSALDLTANANIFASFSSSNVILQTSGAERARIDSSGRLLVGTSSAATTSYNSGLIQLATSTGGIFITSRDDSTVNTGDIIGGLSLWSKTTTSHEECATIFAQADGVYADGDKPTRLVFSTTADGASSPTERMRIGNAGITDLFTSTSELLNLRSASAAGTTDYLIRGRYSATNTQSGTNSFNVFTNGNVTNTNNSYLGISDIKLKENIVDANSQWDDVKALRPVNYNFKEGQTHTQLGLIAQEVELVSPGLVSETPDRDAEGNDLGTVTKSVNYSVLYMKAVKALQEAMERIETLEAKVAALESA